MADNLSSKEKKLAKRILETVAQTMYSSGLLKEQDLKNTKIIRDKIIKFVQTDQFQFVLDHRETILGYALSFSKTHEYNLAIMFYAMFFEHSINSIILRKLHERHFSRTTVLEIIRNVSIQHKITWLIQLLDLPKFNEKHRKVILAGAEKRNAFVHYKFPVVPEELEELEELNEKKLAESLRKTATYMKKYESQILYSGSKAKLRNWLKEITKIANITTRNTS